MSDKLCKDCGHTFPLVPEFWYRNPRNGDGFSSYHKDCHKKRARDSMRRRARPNRAAMYRISEAELNALLDRERCDCCGATCRGKGQHIDHDHQTGLVRGVLCSGCNRGIGFLGDSAEGVERALSYLRGVSSPT